MSREATGVDSLRHGALRYVGHIGANISHEIRNDLALIKEKSGLLGDLLMLSERGKPVSNQRLMQLTEDISRLVGRASSTCTKLSKIAHSADSAVSSVELREQVELVANSTLRRGAGVEVIIEEGDPVGLEVDAILLQYGLFLLLTGAMAVGRGGTITWTIAKDGDQAVVEITAPGLGDLTAAPPQQLVTVLHRLGAYLAGGTGGASARIVIPRNVGVHTGARDSD